MEMFGKEMFVTKEQADEWLKTNQRNRSIKKTKVLKIENAILNGTFECTHQGIAISEEGVLLDGHHRLTAVSGTGITTRMFVIFNAKESTKIDTGVPRSDRDAMYMAGEIEKGSVEYNQLVYPLCGFIAMRNHGKEFCKIIGSAEKHNIFLKFEDGIVAIMNAIKNHSGGRGRSALILYAMLCAYMSGVPQNTLSEWHRIITTGEYDVPGDDKATAAGKSVLNFKKIIDENKRNTSDTNKDQDEVIKKAMSSIRHYVNKNNPEKLYGEFCYKEVTLTKDEIFGNDIRKEKRA